MNANDFDAAAAWAAKDLPARLDTAATARLLGFAEHDIQVLMSTGKLTPLGDPAPNAPKWFSAVEVILLAGNRDWLHRATREVSKYWRSKRERRRHPDTRGDSKQRAVFEGRGKAIPPESRPSQVQDAPLTR